MSNRFDQLADEFIARLRNADIGASTDVVLVYELADAGGRSLEPHRTSIVPLTKVKSGDALNNGTAFAKSLHVEAIVGAIDSLVRKAPDGLVRLRNGPAFPVMIRGISLEILNAQ